jgi:NAD(P)-dependent dehydrogenase (short-subunit alcohol dehydrogenase family)
MTNMTHPSIDLSSKHALVTGGGSGVGAAIALALAAAGARVTIAGRRPEPLAETAGRASRIVGVEADVTDEASVERLFERARAAHGPLDVVVANAGATESAPSPARAEQTCSPTPSTRRAWPCSTRAPPA